MRTAGLGYSPTGVANRVGPSLDSDFKVVFLVDPSGRGRFELKTIASHGTNDFLKKENSQ